MAATLVGGANGQAAVNAAPHSVSVQNEAPASPFAALPSLSLAREWSQLFRVGPQALAAPWAIEFGAAPAKRFDLSQSYLHLMGHGSHASAGFVRLDIRAIPRLSIGPELSWLTPEPPREGCLKTQVLTPGWGVWYGVSGAPFALGLATGTRFLLAEQSTPVVDLLTSEARVAFFLR